MFEKLLGYCVHPKFGKIESGYQYCEQCGKAFPVPPLEPKLCEHKFKILTKLKKHGLFGSVTNKIFFLQCENCGDIKTTDSEI